MVLTTNPKGKIVAKTGNEAMAEAMRQIAPDVVAAYPITPATEIVQIFSQFVADGVVPTEYVAVESEHSAMSACIGSSAAGARTMTGTSSQGLALMWEMLYIAAGLRLPIVMAVVNRALSSPINIHGDQSDTMGARDAGWIQIYSENSQEAYDNMIQGMKIAEQAKLPTMVTTDGFIISHCMEVVETMPDDMVKKFVGEYKPERALLDVKKPYTLGALDLQDYYFEHRYQLADAMNKSKQIILDVAKDFEKEFGRKYDLYEKYRMDDAEVALVIIGSAAGTSKVVVDELREKGVKAGLIKIRVFRPFPHQELAKDLANVKAVAVLDRSDSCAASTAPLYAEVTSALFTHSGGKAPKVVNYVYGLGGRDITLEHVGEVFDRLVEIKDGAKVGEILKYINLR
ncbi:MAG TPA: pyruvate ferredoxin oxidoreductase [Elusimicrobia bacterium]|nr:MAG: pyruvate ferredoxin oxidoreductase [Elusimicrobia bacterium RIFOXYA12_FULL_49_49]OGS09911.1 MAG: pyruvate ferredoxin oxidoreductase [Elusimicrobia bacterium RIFOXYB1_FULL_48_9]OGS15436.1 MAG: pyruvate ferredoxin oxidoreductase [Elusimicrobia bacterium RIFOXYA2_FULL_47_53]OGS30863.1 MAG: pyruvate ferredoxin oxidoreductase [Elusimicrobia bacterium RIFOXYB2_FULL_46_23]HBU69151.1 pyruvate ferredoxin oxidoreductase [Elusimicrobiota bacterium]